MQLLQDHYLNPIISFIIVETINFRIIKDFNSLFNKLSFLQELNSIDTFFATFNINFRKNFITTSSKIADTARIKQDSYQAFIDFITKNYYFTYYVVYFMGTSIIKFINIVYFIKFRG